MKSLTSAPSLPAVHKNNALSLSLSLSLSLQFYVYGDVVKRSEEKVYIIHAYGQYWI